MFGLLLTSDAEAGRRTVKVQASSSTVRLGLLHARRTHASAQIHFVLEVVVQVFAAHHLRLVSLNFEGAALLLSAAGEHWLDCGALFQSPNGLRSLHLLAAHNLSADCIVAVRFSEQRLETLFEQVLVILDLGE